MEKYEPRVTVGSIPFDDKQMTLIIKVGSGIQQLKNYTGGKTYQKIILDLNIKL